MRRLIRISCLVIFILAVSCAGKSAERVTATSHHADMKKNDASGRILVKFRQNTGPDKIKSIQDKYGLEIVRPLNTSGLYLMKITGKTPVETIIEELKKQSAVIYAEPDYRYKVNAEQD